MWIISAGVRRGGVWRWLLNGCGSIEVSLSPPTTVPLTRGFYLEVLRGRAPTQSTFQGLIKNGTWEGTMFGVRGRPVWNPGPAAGWGFLGYPEWHVISRGRWEQTLEALSHERYGWEHFSVAEQETGLVGLNPPSEVKERSFAGIHGCRKDALSGLTGATCKCAPSSFRWRLWISRLCREWVPLAWCFPPMSSIPSCFLGPLFTRLSAPQIYHVQFGILSSPSSLHLPTSNCFSSWVSSLVSVLPTTWLPKQETRGAPPHALPFTSCTRSVTKLHRAYLLNTS